MIRQTTCALALWASMPLAAQNVEDATCGLIAEYAFDLAADAGVPAELAPDGNIWADDDTCYVTSLLLSPDGQSGFRIGSLSFSAKGLEDWVAGHGLPRSLTLRLEGAHLQVRIPDYPAIEWSTNVTNRRSLTSAALNARWDPDAGRLTIDRFELRSPDNGITLSAVIGGIAAEPSQVKIQTLAVHALDARIDMAGAFERLFLTPFAASVMADEKDPKAAFERNIEYARAYLKVVPEPQFDAGTKTALDAFLISLPSPTGRLSLTFDAPEGLQPFQPILSLIMLRSVDPEHMNRVIEAAMGTATLRVDWKRARPR